MTKEKMDLAELAHQIDNASGELNCRVEVLADIKTNLMQMVDDMNNMDEPENLRIYFMEWHRELRILSQLMFHTMRETEETQQNIKRVSEDLFEGIVRNEK